MLRIFREMNQTIQTIQKCISILKYMKLWGLVTCWITTLVHSTGMP